MENLRTSDRHFLSWSASHGWSWPTQWRSSHRNMAER